MLSPSYVGLIVGLVALVIASFSDIKTREVPDWLNYGLVAFAIGSALILSVYHGYWHIIISSLVGLAIGLAIGLLMFYTGQWGGGDSKLIIGLSALIGFSISDLAYGVPLLVIFIINILVVGAVYGLVFTFIKALLNFRKFRQVSEEKLRSKKIIVMRIILLLLGILSLIFLLFTNSIESALIFGLVIILFIFFYLWIFVSTVEKTCMIKKIKVSKLTEGDWILNDVVKKKKVVLKPVKTGVTLKQIAMLKKLRITEVTIKIGIPFVPSFLIAYILTFALGNWLVILI